nr:hypothetical protein GCM10020093_025610 [Planobispora longispora]
MAQPTPGTPSLLRAINDRAAIQAFLERGPLTRPEIGALTGLSKPTASQLLSRLQDAGLVVLDGIREDFPAARPRSTASTPASPTSPRWTSPSRIEARVADITGAVTGEHRLPTPGRSGRDIVGGCAPRSTAPGPRTSPAACGAW